MMNNKKYAIIIIPVYMCLIIFIHTQLNMKFHMLCKILKKQVK